MERAYTMWEQLWINCFGSTDGWLGLDWGFWVSMGVVALFVIFQNVWFWNQKPFAETRAGKIAAEKAAREAAKEKELSR